MAEPAHLKRVTRAVEALREIPDPLVRLDEVRQAIERLEVLQAQTVEQAREAGRTWGEIGSLYGLTKQGAQQRFRPSHRRLTD